MKRVILSIVIFVSLFAVFYYYFMDDNQKTERQKTSLQKDSQNLNKDSLNQKQSILKEVIHSYRTDTCSCCKEWIAYVKKAGVAIEDHVQSSIEIQKEREKLKIPGEMYSCHIAKYRNYHLEGHLPLEAIFYLEKERPSWIAIGVPGMPFGSPGMEDLEYPKEGPKEGPRRYEIYQVLVFENIKIPLFPFMQFKGLNRVF